MAPQVSRPAVRDEGLVATLLRPPESGRCPDGHRGRRLRRRSLGSPGGVIGVPRFCHAGTGLLRYRAASRVSGEPPGVLRHGHALAPAAGRCPATSPGGASERLAAVSSRASEGQPSLRCARWGPRCPAACCGWASPWVARPTQSPHPHATWQGRPRPCMRGGMVGSAIDWTHPPVALAPGYVAALQNRRLVEEATMPMDKTQGPILLISGPADQCPRHA